MMFGYQEGDMVTCSNSGSVELLGNEYLTIVAESEELKQHSATTNVSTVTTNVSNAVGTI
jgi:hypothetical protein